jgi:hypothetical protein
MLLFIIIINSFIKKIQFYIFLNKVYIIYNKKLDYG